MPDIILGSIINNYLNINSAIITLVTIGLITIITIVAYSLERIIGKSSPSYQKFFKHLIEGLVLTFSMIMLQQIFHILNTGSINHGWLYANAQLTILLYCMYLIRNKITLLINILMPFAYYTSINLDRLENKNLPFFAVSYIFLVIIVIYIYQQTEKLQRSEWKYLIMQLFFGLSWWILLWVDHSFPMLEIINMLIVFLIYMAIIRFCAKKLEDTMINYDDLKVKVNYDELTGIRNRASLDKTAQELFETYSNEEIPLTVTMFDIDHFKEFNDTYGHSTGDEVLKHVAQTIEREMFLGDAKGELFRFGGEEFIIVFRGKKPAQCIPIIANLREALTNTPLVLNGEKLEITISFGVSKLDKTDLNFDDLFNRVDRYLYESKNLGRNRLTVEGLTYNFNKLTK
ncbi:GGDEF domain-containing protein [Companilactobacillus halodurans]|uniref:GGDEF domain-containing protein n=1 Tax=Companilactobacillus halodurans TaxID=2584183 RepID=A0A5P0ZZQ6_9LACO|nr:GGDEF domain-containing protein [Companilactobacillus halodurans]MQS75929.1 GGDEF domain-containing protein [Companilactobacillus halodurans]MQS98539.1 GGDEF domain-containing protein [Companilactobacillus halodurans]